MRKRSLSTFRKVYPLTTRQKLGKEEMELALKKELVAKIMMQCRK